MINIRQMKSRMGVHYDKLGKIVCGKNLESAKRLRKNPYIEEKNRKVALAELEEEGWEYVKDYDKS